MKNAKQLQLLEILAHGKTIISSILSKFISEKNKKVLLIDFDIFNSNINTIFGVKKYAKNTQKIDTKNDEKNGQKNNNIINKKYTNFENNFGKNLREKNDNFFTINDEKININNYIFSINKNLNILLGIDEMLEAREKEELLKIKKILNILKKEYDFIIIDTSSRLEFKYVKLVLSSAEKIIFLIEPNVLEIQKSKNMLDVFIRDWNIEIDKIKIVFNKTNMYQIAESILEEIYYDFEVLGKIEYEQKYNLFINKNTKCFLENKEYENIYQKMNV